MTSSTPPADDRPRAGVDLQAPDAAPDSQDAGRFRGWQWRLGNVLASTAARLGIGPIALLTTTGRRTGRQHTVPVVPVDHDGREWLVAPYGPVSWVHNVRQQPRVLLRYGRRRTIHVVREVGPAAAGGVLKRYVAVATRARDAFDAAPDASPRAFAAEAPGHPVFELLPSP